MSDYPNQLTLKPIADGVLKGWGEYEGMKIRFACAEKSRFDTGPRWRLLFSTYDSNTKSETAYAIALFKDQQGEGCSGSTDTLWANMKVFTNDDGSASIKVYFKPKDQANVQPQASSQPQSGFDL